MFKRLDRKNPSLEILLREQVLHSLRPAANGMSIVYAALLISHGLFLTGNARLIMMTIASLSALSYGIFAWLLRTRRPADNKIHMLAGLFVIIALINSFAHLYVQHDILQTTNIAFAMMAIGGFFLSFRWLIGMMIGTIVVWAAMIATVPPSPYTFHFAFALMIATMLGLIFFQVRIRMFAKLNESDQREKEYQSQLEQSVVEAKHNEQRFKALAQATHEGVVIYNATGVVDVNDSVIRMIGIEYDYFLGRPIFDFIHPDDYPIVEHNLKLQTQTPYEIRIVSSKGIAVPVVVQGQSVRYEGQPARIVTITDISQQKEVEANLLRAKESAEQASRAKSSFLSTLSHEFRTPLNAIIGYSEIVRDELTDRGIDDVHEELDRIVAAGRRLLSMISNVLELVQIEAESHHLNLQYVQIKEILMPLLETFHYHAEKNRSRIEIDETTIRGDMFTDEAIVVKILHNVFDNAVKFTTNGIIRVAVHHSYSPDGPVVDFIVADTGVGIAESQLERIFEPFAQADETSTRVFEGVGMGLTLSQRLCALLGGSIRITSELGKGTTCTVSLPAMPEFDVEV